MNTTPCQLLLVDDNPHQLKLMKLTLEGHGYTIHTAQDGQEALEMIPQNPPDGIISDVLMPRLDGFQLCHALREDKRFSHLPIVLLSSAYTEAEDLRLAKDAGANALLTRIPDAQCLARQAVESLKAPAKRSDSVSTWSSKQYQERLAHQLIRQARHAEENAQKADCLGEQANKFGCALGEARERLHQIEEQLRQSQKLESVGQMAAGVAHELNNPLSAVLGFTQCLIHQPDAPDRVDLLHTMERETLRCCALVRDMLTFTRKSSAQTTWEHLPILADSVLSLISARAKTVHVTIERHYAENLPAIFVNGNQIQQVLINLCGNALDAMPKGGTLSVTIDTVGDNFILCVNDTGAGISPEQMPRIFEPFFTTKEVGKGTGLGLSLVHDIIMTHNGHVEVESKVGRGTTFRVSLPIGEVLK